MANLSQTRNYITKLNKKKKKLYYENIINIKHDSKKMWNILNDIMGRKSKSTPSFLKSEGHFITKPLDIADHLNNYFNDKVNKLRVEMSQTNSTQSFALIRDRIT